MLTPLENIKPVDLVAFDQDTLNAETIARIKANPEWNELWDGELYQNASQVILNLFSFMFAKTANSFNMKLKEKFLNQAYSEEAIVDNLKDMNINLYQRHAAEVEIFANINNIDFKFINKPIVLSRFFALNAKDLNGQNIVFEIINKINNQYDYFSNVVIYPSDVNKSFYELKAYAGTTFQKYYDITWQTLENFKINLNVTNIEENSIQVFYQPPDLGPVRLNQVSSFLTPRSPHILFPDDEDGNIYGLPNFIIQYGANGNAYILFGERSFNKNHVTGPAFASQLFIIGRQTYDASANIQAFGIKENKNFTVDGTVDINVTFANRLPGYGGQGAETIYAAQEFAPYRYGREHGVIDQQDAKNKLYKLINKHKIDTPQYNETNNTVPLLHAWHYVVPYRNFKNLELPYIDENTELAYFQSDFISRVNTFANLNGMHDEAVFGEYAGFFSSPINNNYNFYYTPKNKYPFSGSLVAKAYNYKNEQIDRIIWDGNYLISPTSNTSKLPTEHATIKSAVFSTIQIINETYGRNNFMILKIDTFTKELQITLTTTGGQTPEEFAANLNAAIVDAIIKQDSNNMGAYTEYQFVSHEMVTATTGRIIIRSILSGIDAKLQVISNGITNDNPSLDLYTMLGIEEKIYRSESESGVVFNQCSYNYVDNLVYFNINSNNIDKAVIITDIPIQNPAIETGPEVTYILTDENLDDISQVLENTNINVKAYLDTTLVDHLIFTNVSSNEVTKVGTIAISRTTGVFNDNYKNTYNYATGSLFLNFNDGIEAPPIYDQTYPVISKITITPVTVTSPGVYADAGAPIVFLDDDNNWSQDINTLTGPTITLTNVELTEGLNYRVQIINTVETVETVKDWLVFLNIANVTNQAVSDHDTPGLVINYAADIILNNVANTLTFTCIDGTENTELTSYVSGCDPYNKIEITYQRKNYEYIVLDYKPNIYKSEGEAANLQAQLMDASTRLIGLEHVFKRVNFVPFKIDILLTIKKGFSLANASNRVKEVLYSALSFNNVNNYSDINTAPSEAEFKNILNTDLTNFGIKKISLLNELNFEITEPSYFFLLDNNIISEMETLEAKFVKIIGLSSLYKSSVSAVYE